MNPSKVYPINMLTNPGYFLKVEAIIGQGRSLIFAYRETEKDFERHFGLRRFVTYRGFYDAYTKHRAGVYPRFILLHNSEIKI